MGRVKGCVNKACTASQKKITYKKGDDYCSKCGNKLYYVCKECHTQLPDDSEKYCVRCLAEKQDHKVTQPLKVRHLKLKYPSTSSILHNIVVKRKFKIE